MGDFDALLLQSLQSLRDEGMRRDEKLDRLMDKLEPLPGLVDDMAEVKPKVDRLEVESHRRAGVIAVVCTAIGLFGTQVADWLLSSIGKK